MSNVAIKNAAELSTLTYNQLRSLAKEFNVSLKNPTKETLVAELTKVITPVIDKEKEGKQATTKTNKEGVYNLAAVEKGKIVKYVSTGARYEITEKEVKDGAVVKIQVSEIDEDGNFTGRVYNLKSEKFLNSAVTIVE